MGEVYRARDTRLDRDVAIKILPEAFTADAERVARFQREAKVLASLNHHNIATIHGLEQTDGAHALVMELVEGEDLAQRLARGAIPMVYADDEGSASRQLTWFDRTGRTLATLGDAGLYNDLALSPDESRVAISLATGNPDNHDIWIVDVARNVRSRLTADPGADRSPLWSRDGARIAYEAERSGKVSLRRQSANGTGVDELLLEVPGTPSRPCGTGQCSVTPSGWSADGRYIAYTIRGSFPATTDVWILPLFGDRKPFPLANTEFLEGSGTFSPAESGSPTSPASLACPVFTFKHFRGRARSIAYHGTKGTNPSGERMAGSCTTLERTAR